LAKPGQKRVDTRAYSCGAKGAAGASDEWRTGGWGGAGPMGRRCGGIRGAAVLDQAGLVENDPGPAGKQRVAEPMAFLGLIRRNLLRLDNIVGQDAGRIERALDDAGAIVVIEQAWLRLRYACHQQEREERLHKAKDDAVQVHEIESLRVTHCDRRKRKLNAC